MSATQPSLAPGGGYPLARNVSSPLTADMLRPPDPRCRTVQFSRSLTGSDYRVLADWMAQYHSVSLRAFGSYDGSIRDLDFLRFFPYLHDFSADALYHSLESIEGLNYLPVSATTIGLGQTKKRLSLKPLGRFTNLRRLQLEGHTKDIDAISGLRSLHSVTLRSITLPDLSILQPLTQLRALDLKLGAARDLALLPTIGQLDYLELWMVRGLHDLSPVAELGQLSYLLLRSQKQITQLPDFTGLSRLETIWLETMTGLTDLSPLLSAPSLRRAAVVDMAHLQPEAVGVLASHPRLEQIRIGLGNTRKNEAARELVPLPVGDGWARADRRLGE